MAVFEGRFHKEQDRLHALVIPVYRLGTDDAVQLFRERLREWCRGVDLVVLVDNNPDPDARLDDLASGGPPLDAPVEVWRNGNQGGLAGGFNLGTTRAMASGATLITLLDQDSELDARGLRRLREPWGQRGDRRLVVGPMVLNVDTGRPETGGGTGSQGYVPTRLLISSGTTFLAADHGTLGPLHEGLFIDYLDHIWCFRAIRKGFALVQHTGVVLHQRFGHPHPHGLCRRLGMQLYSPMRHYYALRNLRWLCRQGEVPADIKLKEGIRMVFKPWLWLLCEPRRRANARAIWAGLTDPLPGPHP